MEIRKSDELTIEKVRRDVSSAWYSLEDILQPPLDAEGSRGLLKPRSSGLEMVEKGIYLIGRYPNLLGAGFDPEAVRQVHARQTAMKVLASTAEGFAGQLRDTVRQDAVFLYKAVMTAYAVAQCGNANAEIAQFALDMKEALSVGPRMTRTNASPIDHAGSEK